MNIQMKQQEVPGFIERIGLRRSKGVELTEMDRHLLRHSKNIQLGLFRPSLVSTFLNTLSVFIMPAPFFFLFTILVASSHISGDYLASAALDAGDTTAHDMTLEEFALQSDEVEIIFEDTLKNDLEAAKIQAEKLEAKENETIQVRVAMEKAAEELHARSYSAGSLPSVSIDQNPHRGMVQFISGLISVYLPDIDNAGEIATEVVGISKKEDVDPLYVAAVISVESRFSVTARSHVGAMGLMQLMPATAQEVSAKITGEKSKPKLADSKTNIVLGITYLKELEARYRGDRRLALAAYNWGPGNVDKVIKGESKIPASVQSYVKTILTRTSRWNKHHFHASTGAARLLKEQVG